MEPQLGRSEERERDPYAPYGAGEAGVENPYAPVPGVEWPPRPPDPPWKVLLRRLWAPIVALGLLVWKLKAVVLVVFKLKIFTTAASMLVSIAAYALFWGWQFAVGFVLLMLVHEFGHVLEARRQGLPVSAPMFIPFLGAAILLKDNPRSVWHEALIAFGGPVIGSLGAAAVWLAGVQLDSDLLRALAFTGFFLNLFNLVPVVPLDGGRITAAIHPVLWFVGFAALVALLFVAPNPILLIIALLAGFELWRRWRERGVARDAGYYRIARWQRVAASVAYFGLAAVLTVAMGASYIEREL
jgi:Zn-dependent protease